MREDELFEAFSFVDEEIISKASEGLFDAISSRHVRKKVILCVACMVLVISLLLSMIPLYIVLSKNDIKITPRDIELLFENEESNDNYQLLSAKELDYYGYRNLSSSADSAYVFEKVALSNKDKQSSADKYLSAIKSYHGNGVAWDTREIDEYSLSTSGTWYGISFDEYKTVYEVKNTESTSEIISKNADKNSLLDSVMPIEDYVNKIFGTSGIFDNFTSSSVLPDEENGKATLRVWCAENGDSLDHVDLDFTLAADGNYYLSGISFEKLSFNKIMSDLVGTKKGQQLLDNGYTFANGLCCSICDRGLKFGDDCECMLVYYHQSLDENTTSYLIPFYAFSMKVADDLYAVTYVPAIEIPGLYKYFEQKYDEHIKQEHEKEAPPNATTDPVDLYTGIFEGVSAQIEIIDEKNAQISFVATAPVKDDTVSVSQTVLVTAKYTYQGRAHLADNVLTLKVSRNLISQLSLNGAGKDEYLSQKEQYLREQVEIGKITPEQMQNSLALLNGNGSTEISHFIILQFSLNNKNASFKIFREEKFDENKRLAEVNMYEDGLLAGRHIYESGKLIQTIQYIYDKLGEPMGQTEKYY